MSMPAVTMRLEMTKQDMRNGRNTGWPVSKQSVREDAHKVEIFYQDAA